LEISLIQSCRSRGFAIEPPFTNQEIREGSAKALLDTNVWRYVADCGFAAQLLKTQKEKRKEVRVTVAPTTVFEIAKIGDQDLRKKIAKSGSRIKRGRGSPTINLLSANNSTKL
jgi:hypothetical protein